MARLLNPASITLDHVRAAIQLADFDVLSAQAQMAPAPHAVLPENLAKPVREAGVLVLIFPKNGDGLRLVLTRRTESLRGHSGQISFLGGRRVPDDKSFTATALRETCEELGICDRMTVLGQLSPIYIPPTHYNVYPSVAFLDLEPVFCPNPVEVAEVFTLSLYELLDERNKHLEYHDFRGIHVKIPYYRIQEHKVWGATAVMLSEFEHRLRSVL